MYLHMYGSGYVFANNLQDTERIDAGPIIVDD